MSRIGKKPIDIPAGVTVTVNEGFVTVAGKLGKLDIVTQKFVKVAVEGNQIILTAENDTAEASALHGLNRSLINNAVIGVTQGYRKNLEIVGTGFRADLAGKTLTMSVGCSHKCIYEVPEGLKVTVTDGYKIQVEGYDKQQVGEAAATIRAFRKPEPYKGKGIRYADEVVTLKQGKKNA